MDTTTKDLAKAVRYSNNVRTTITRLQKVVIFIESKDFIANNPH